MGLVCRRQPSRSGPRPVLAELKKRGSWEDGEDQGHESPLGTGDKGVASGSSLVPSRGTSRLR